MTWRNMAQHALGSTNKQSETMGFLPPACRDFCQDASEVVRTSIAVHGHIFGSNKKHENQDKSNELDRCIENEIAW